MSGSGANSVVTLGDVRFGNDLPLALIAGPCQMESAAHALECAAAIKEIATRRGIGVVFKTSFDKANRTSIKGARGMGIKAALPVFAEIRERYGMPVLTDVHEYTPMDEVASVVDVLQTPAFLVRQTDFIRKVCSAGKPVNIKKGQFLSPWDMKPVVEKAKSTGNGQIRYGADVINRIIESEREGGSERLQRAVVEESLRPLIQEMCAAAKVKPEQVYRMCLAGNTTMNHLLLGLYALLDDVLL